MLSFIIAFTNLFECVNHISDSLPSKLAFSGFRPRGQKTLAETTAVTALFDSSHQLGTKPGDLRLVVYLLGKRQQPFEFVDTLLKVHPLFKIHGYFTLRPSL